ncbi:MAG: helix-turn-helix domain-containing protein [Candidatus Melainabacteria bacterium]|jgi:excisionase family DNA binding protein|nr:helix-turn-helix domain-containing protein [Candidatus Melainabacteria bacterium]
MTDTARNTEHTDPVSTDGMADLFNSSDRQSQDSFDSQVISLDSVEAGSDSQDKAVSVQEAARRMGISPRTVLRRLNKGSLVGYKIDGTFGTEWRVSLDSFDKQSQDSFDSQVISFDTVEAASVSQDTTEDSLILELREQISVLRQELINERIEAQRHLQAAVFRNGYLEAQLEGKDNEIKLLTDREQQSKATWWQRFKQIWQKQ